MKQSLALYHCCSLNENTVWWSFSLNDSWMLADVMTGTSGIITETQDAGFYINLQQISMYWCTCTVGELMKTMESNGSTHCLASWSCTWYTRLCLVWFGLAVMYHVINVATLLWYPISTVFFWGCLGFLDSLPFICSLMVKNPESQDKYSSKNCIVGDLK